MPRLAAGDMPRAKMFQKNDELSPDSENSGEAPH